MSIEEIRKFSDEINSKIHFDYDLKKSNWFNIGGQAKVCLLYTSDAADE